MARPNAGARHVATVRYVPRALACHMPILAATVVALALLAWITRWADGHDTRRMRTHLRAVVRRFEAAGLSMRADAPRWMVEGGPPDARVTVSHAWSHEVPGAPATVEGGRERVLGSLAEFDDPGPDAFVAEPARVLKCMGPVPGVPRQTTGHAAFDRRYEVRAASPVVAPTLALDTLGDLGLQWMHRTNGRMRVVLRALDPAEVPRVVEALAAWRTGVAVSAAPAPPQLAPIRPDVLSTPIWVAWAASIVLAFPVGLALVTTIRPLALADAAFGCEDGRVAAPAPGETAAPGGGCNRTEDLRCADGTPVGEGILLPSSAQGAVVVVSLGVLVSARRAWRARGDLAER